MSVTCANKIRVSNYKDDLQTPSCRDPDTGAPLKTGACATSSFIAPKLMLSDCTDFKKEDNRVNGAMLMAWQKLHSNYVNDVDDDDPNDVARRKSNIVRGNSAGGQQAQYPYKIQVCGNGNADGPDWSPPTDGTGPSDMMYYAFEECTGDDCIKCDKCYSNWGLTDLQSDDNTLLDLMRMSKSEFKDYVKDLKRLPKGDETNCEMCLAGGLDSLTGAVSFDVCGGSIPKLPNPDARKDTSYNVYQTGYPKDKFEDCCAGTLTPTMQSRWCHPDWFAGSKACGQSNFTKNLCTAQFLGDHDSDDRIPGIQRLKGLADALTTKETCEKTGFVWRSSGDTFKCKAPRLLYDVRCNPTSAFAARKAGRTFDAAVNTFCDGEYSRNEEAKRAIKPVPADFCAGKSVNQCAESSNVCTYDVPTSSCVALNPDCSIPDSKDACNATKGCQWTQRLDDNGDPVSFCVDTEYKTNYSYTSPRVCWLNRLKSRTVDATNSDFVGDIPNSVFLSTYDALSAAGTGCSRMDAPLTCWLLDARKARASVSSMVGKTQDGITSDMETLAERVRTEDTTENSDDVSRINAEWAKIAYNRMLLNTAEMFQPCPKEKGCCCMAMTMVDNVRLGKNSKVSISTARAQCGDGCAGKTCIGGQFIGDKPVCSDPYEPSDNNDKNKDKNTDDPSKKSSDTQKKSSTGSGLWEWIGIGGGVALALAVFLLLIVTAFL